MLDCSSNPATRRCDAMDCFSVGGNGFDEYIITSVFSDNKIVRALRGIYVVQFALGV
jgi:hypothetical protein